MIEEKRKQRPNIKGEIDELQRVSQDLSRDYGIDVTVKDLIDAFNSSTEQTIPKNIWGKLENTESNEIEKGDFKSVEDIAKKYNKTSPRILAKSLKSGEYTRPLIVSVGDKYILVAGNTRLCTAAAMGMNPKVFIAKIDNNMKGELDEACWKGYKQIGGKIKNGKQVPNCVPKNKSVKMDTKEMTGADSSGSFSAPGFGGKKTVVKKIHNTKKEEELAEVTDASSSGSYDVPLFGGTKGRKNPLSIGGPDSIYKGRAVKDKNFPKFGGPGGKFVKIKDKCKKYPYCTQGDMSAIELLESQEIKSAIHETAKKYGLSTKEVSNLVLNQIKEIFI